MGHLGRPIPADVPRRTITTRESKHSRSRGKSGEREVVRMWRTAGWDDARRQPGSGSIRPYGAGDRSPWPLDIASGYPAGYAGPWPWPNGPWIVEVKFAEVSVSGGRNTWPGSTFIRKTLRAVHQHTARHNSTIGANPVYPALFVRANRSPWRVFVPADTFVTATAGFGSISVDSTGWVDVDTGTFFGVLARSVLDGGGADGVDE